MDKVLLIDTRDNVVTAVEPVAAGDLCQVVTPSGTVSLTAAQAIGMGHKLALYSIAQGQPVIKYGAAIGNATSNIAPGEHVHSHNLSGLRGRE